MTENALQEERQHLIYPTCSELEAGSGRLLESKYYQGSVILDGMDVSNACAAVHVIGEHPHCLLLYKLDDAGRKISDHGAAARYWQQGAITMQLHRK